MRIDLHTHSTASDGTLSPAAVVHDAARSGLDVVALTDHDTIAGWAEATEAAHQAGIALVRGVEISCRTPQASVHLLGYLHDPDHAGLAASLERARSARARRAVAITELVARDFPITWHDVVEATPPGATVGRPHIADALVKAGVVVDRDVAFAEILATGGPYDLPYDVPTPSELIRLVREAGGVPVLAHPFASVRGATLTEADIAELAAVGLMGLEVDHRDHTEDDRGRLRALARDLNLLVTGSSDFHGAGKRNRLGENVTSPEVFAALEAAGYLEVIR